MWQNTATWLGRTVQCAGTRLVYAVHQTLPSLAEVGLACETTYLYGVCEARVGLPPLDLSLLGFPEYVPSLSARSTQRTLHPVLLTALCMQSHTNWLRTLTTSGVVHTKRAYVFHCVGLGNGGLKKVTALTVQSPVSPWSANRCANKLSHFPANHAEIYNDVIQ